MMAATIQSLILDMDGVLWRGEAPIGDLAAIFAQIRARGLRFAFATNNGTRTPEQYVARLAAFGIPAEPWQVVTSSLALAELLAQRFVPPHGRRVFAIGEIGLFAALQEKGFDVVGVDEAEQAEIVVMGIDREINFRKMVEATLLVRRGRPFYATNPDRTFPTPRGEIPGAGAWISVVVMATGIEPVYAGKPASPLLTLAQQRLGTSREATLVVGDRLETDIAAAQAAGFPCALVLSGVTPRAQAADWNPPPDFIAEDLASLIASLP